jgi:anti-sigma regulatory factor (Ser/Thr protein kinase)
MTSYEVREELDVYDARRGVTALGARLGFPRLVCIELAIVVSELCTNILKYGVRGSIEMRGIRDDRRGLGVEVVARDQGPPFRDLGKALCDGCDDRGPIDAALLGRRQGLGSGLGAVARFTHALSVEPEPNGKRIVVRRYVDGAIATTGA